MADNQRLLIATLKGLAVTHFFLKIIIQHAETQKGVLGVTLTSIVYKILVPSQDIRNHQNGMPGGYSGKSFDTKYITPYDATIG